MKSSRAARSSRHLRADPGADPLQARDRRRLPRPDRGEHDRRRGGCRRSSTAHGPRRSLARCDELLDYTERRTRAELAALPHGVYEAEGTVDVDGYTDQPVRLRGADRDRRRRRRVRPDRLRPAAPRAGQLDLRADVLGLRLRAQVPDRPRPAGQRRLLPRHPPRRAARARDELHLAEPGRRRLGDADAARRHDLPRAPPRAARAAAGGDQGDDVPRRLRRRRPGDGEYYCFLETFGGGYGGRPRATDRTRCRRTARTPRTRRSRRRSSTTRCAWRGSRSSRTPRAPGRFRGGLGLRKDFVFDRPTTFTVLADRTLRRPVRARSAATRAARRVRPRSAAARRHASRPKATIELEAGDDVSYRTCGGGGYGPPEERDPELVRARRARGKGVGRARARVYRWRQRGRRGSIDGDSGAGSA